MRAGEFSTTSGANKNVLRVMYFRSVGVTTVLSTNDYNTAIFTLYKGANVLNYEWEMTEYATFLSMEIVWREVVA